MSTADVEQCFDKTALSNATSTQLRISVTSFDDMPLLSISLVLGLYILACLLGGLVLYYGPSHKLELVGKFDMVTTGMETFEL